MARQYWLIPFVFIVLASCSDEAEQATDAYSSSQTEGTSHKHLETIALEYWEQVNLSSRETYIAFEDLHLEILDPLEITDGEVSWRMIPFLATNRTAQDFAFKQRSLPGLTADFWWWDLPENRILSANRPIRGAALFRASLQENDSQLETSEPLDALSATDRTKLFIDIIEHPNRIPMYNLVSVDTTNPYTFKVPGDVTAFEVWEDGDQWRYQRIRLTWTGANTSLPIQYLAIPNAAAYQIIGAKSDKLKLAPGDVVTMWALIPPGKY